MMMNWLSKKIIKHFRDKAIAQINANPTEVAKYHFKGVVEVLNRRYNNLGNLYWVGSYVYAKEIPTYFKLQKVLSKEILSNLPFNRSTEGEKIVDIFIGECNINNQWIIAFFCDNIELERRSNLMDTFFINKDEVFRISEQEYLKIV